MSDEREAAKLLEIVRQLAGASRPDARLESRLDRDLGFDSLSRVELLLRIERAFGISLPEPLLTRAETVRDLLLAVRAGRPGVRTQAVVADLGLQKISGVPENARTLCEALIWHVDSHPARTHLVLPQPDGEDFRLSYRDLLQGANQVASGLIARELAPGETVAIMLPTGADYFFSFFGVLLAGAIPVPIYPPFRPSQLEDHLRRNAGILANCGAVFMITWNEAQGVARLLKMQLEKLRQVLTIDELAGSPQPHAMLAGEHTALLQYTSGSTGNPKGVVLTHANLLANIRAMGVAARVDSSDVFVSWLPLYHDMGLIGAWLGSLYHGCPLVVMPPQSFLARPERWLWALDRYHGTLSASPNFGFELCLNKIDERDIEGLDLCGVRMLFNGAEPVSAETVSRFALRFGRYGLKPQAISPVYGLAECSVGLAFSPAGRGPVIDRVAREAFELSGRAIAATGDADSLRVVSCGLPLPGHQVRVVDETGRELGERRQGRLEFKGPSATAGYFGNPEATRALFHGDWLDSGDYAYLAAGEIHVTGRAKDLIIRGGRNYYPYETERAVGDLPGVRRGCVAVFGVPDPNSGTERLVVMLETRGDASDEALRTRVASTAYDILGFPVDDIVLVPARTLLKTSSGKIRRSACRALYQRGAPTQGRLWLVRLALAAMVPAARRLAGISAAMFYAGYVAVVFWLIAPLAWLCAAASSRPSLAWSVSRRWARLFLWASRIDLSVEGLGNLPAGKPCVLAINHASYLDGIAVVASFPGNSSPAGFFRFVAKRELLHNFVSRVFLRRLGADFVERFDFRQGVEDVTRLQSMAANGMSLAFFPEGTFSRVPGLAAFKMGAFVCAAASRVPLVPVTLRGTRSILRDGSWFVRQGRIEVFIGTPISAPGSGWEDAVSLRDLARVEILNHCGEPDLGINDAHG